MECPKQKKKEKVRKDRGWLRKRVEQLDHCRCRITNKSNGLLEMHHIIPRSLGGEDTPENCILLTWKEHRKCDGRIRVKGMTYHEYMLSALLKIKAEHPDEYRWSFAEMYLINRINIMAVYAI